MKRRSLMLCYSLIVHCYELFMLIIDLLWHHHMKRSCVFFDGNELLLVNLYM